MLFYINVRSVPEAEAQSANMSVSFGVNKTSVRHFVRLQAFE
jgi:hypothetical protein